jgi:hypothetical protein
METKAGCKGSTALFAAGPDPAGMEIKEKYI